MPQGQHVRGHEQHVGWVAHHLQAKAAMGPHAPGCDDAQLGARIEHACGRLRLQVQPKPMRRVKRQQMLDELIRIIFRASALP